jgi:hypothetical protein
MAEYELWVETEKMKALKGSGTGIMSRSAVVQALTIEELGGKAEAKEEIRVELKDPAKMESFKAKAVVSQKPEEMPGADTLWLVNTQGRLPQPWAIKIVERIEEEERDVIALPKRRLSIGERKGRMLMDLLKEREEKTKKKGE